MQCILTSATRCQSRNQSRKSEMWYTSQKPVRALCVDWASVPRLFRWLCAKARSEWLWVVGKFQSYHTICDATTSTFDITGIKTHNRQDGSLSRSPSRYSCTYTFCCTQRSVTNALLQYAFARGHKNHGAINVTTYLRNFK